MNRPVCNECSGHMTPKKRSGNERWWKCLVCAAWRKVPE